jgi:hypothetical protein
MFKCSKNTLAIVHWDFVQQSGEKTWTDNFLFVYFQINILTVVRVSVFLFRKYVFVQRMNISREVKSACLIQLRLLLVFYYTVIGINKVAPHSLLEVNKTLAGSRIFFTLVACLAYSSTLKMEGYVPPKRRFTFKGLHTLYSRREKSL